MGTCFFRGRFPLFWRGFVDVFVFVCFLLLLDEKLEVACFRIHLVARHEGRFASSVFIGVLTSRHIFYALCLTQIRFFSSFSSLFSSFLISFFKSCISFLDRVEDGSVGGGENGVETSGTGTGGSVTSGTETGTGVTSGTTGGDGDTGRTE